MSKHKKTDKKIVSQSLHPYDMQQPFWSILLKFVFLLTAISFCLWLTDAESFFLENQTNNHTVRKWDAYYDFTRRNEVDILLVGNSHLYTGINPKNLSTALNCNAFILASPGTGVVDYFYTLKEAIEVNQPKVVIIETYGITDSDPKTYIDADLVNQIKSFDARKNIRVKLESTPVLFNHKNYGYAWSSSIRNHNYLLTDYDQIEKNRKAKKKTEEDLYLGRYVRFTSGLKKGTLHLYDSLGAPVDGSEVKIGELSAKWVDRIVEMCEVHHIKVHFLTLPMYEKHIKDYALWKGQLSKILNLYDQSFWLDLQDSANYSGFTTESFENTMAENQHMTYRGSLLATYKLANKLKALAVDLPDRSKTTKWIEHFYGEEGYFENHQPHPTDTLNRILYQANGDQLVQSILQIDNDSNALVLLKINPNSPERKGQILTNKVKVLINVQVEGKTYRSSLELLRDEDHILPDQTLYSRHFEKVKIVAVKNVEFID